MKQRKKSKTEGRLKVELKLNRKKIMIMMLSKDIRKSVHANVEKVKD